MSTVDDEVLLAQQHQQQADEVVALSIIYPHEFRLMSRRLTSGDLDFKVDAYEFPIRYAISLSSTLALYIEYPLRYPDEIPELNLKEETENFGECDIFTRRQNMQIILEAIRDEIEIGMPCVLQCVQVGRDRLEEIAKTKIAANDNSYLNDNDANEEEEEETLFQSIGVFDTIPRPVLIMILYKYCNVKDRGRLSVASKLIRTIIDRRSQRELSKLREEDKSTELDDWERHRSMTIDGVQRKGWELDVIRAKEERKIASSHEHLWRRRCTKTFQLSPNSNGELWSVHEGDQESLLATTAIAATTSPLTASEGTTAPKQSSVANQSWILGGYVFHYARALEPISFVSERWYLARARLRALHQEDGDIFVGLVRENFDTSPSTFVRIIPGGGFGVESNECAFINIISAQNRREGHPMEINLGLHVHKGFAEYGIPHGLHFGRPIYNSGKVKSEIRNFSSNEELYLAVLSARSTDQSDFHVYVKTQRCSKTEWYGQLEEPYNFL